MRIQGGTDSILALLAARRSSALSGGVKSAEQAAEATMTTESVAAAPERRILDFTRMTPGEMKGVAKGLFDAGEIDLTQLFMLQTAGAALGKVGANGEFVPLSDAERDAFNNQPTNYFQVAQGAMEFIEQSNRANDPTAGYANWKGIVQALQRATGGVDVVG